MARSYTVHAFFRNTPNNLLACFFERFKLFSKLDFASMKETKPDQLIEAWNALPAEERIPLDAIQQEIFELSCEKGFVAIRDEARWQMGDALKELEHFTTTLAELPNHYHRAMITYLDYPGCWKGAIRFYHADSMNSHWRKRKHMGNRPAAVDTISASDLANRIKSYFSATEGRGNNCVVEVFRRGDLDYFFAYPEDFSQQAVEWVEGEFGIRPHNPAFEIIFIYSQKDGTLDINFRGSKNAIESLQHMFANAILKLEQTPPDPKDSRIYDLNPLRNRGFTFNYVIESRIECVRVKKIRFTSRIKHGDRITVEANVNDGGTGIYDQIEKISSSVPLNHYDVSQVELSVTYRADENQRAQKITVRITHPNSCSLKYDELGLKIREMLASSGIEPKEPIEEETEELAEA